MKMRLLGIASVLALSASLLAHHSMGMYDSSKFVVVEGTIARVEWRNPHAVVHLNAIGPDGKESVQRVEIAGPNSLQNRGFAPTLLVVGERIAMQTWLPKVGSGVPNGRNIILADGRQFDVSDNWGEKFGIDRVDPRR